MIFLVASSPRGAVAFCLLRKPSIAGRMPDLTNRAGLGATFPTLGLTEHRNHGTVSRSNWMIVMTLAEWMMIGAILVGPILAVQVQKYIEMLREKRGRRLQIFHTLMATRADRTSLSHVEALNRIDLEFHAPAFRQPFYQAAGARSVGEAWKLYRDHLNTRYDEHELQAWGRRGNELFTDLLYQMGKSLGYEFDKVELSKGVYSPKAHGQE